MDKTPKVLFISRGNASRAQIAEGFVRALSGDRLVPFGTGTESADVHPLATEVMAEVGIDISAQRPHDVASLFRETFRYAVALCDEPRERHPVFPFTPNLLTWAVVNPEVVTSEPEATKETFRQVRDQIRGRVEEFLEAMNQPKSAFAKAHAKAA